MQARSSRHVVSVWLVRHALCRRRTGTFLFRKGANFTAAMAFQLASTNLVLALGILLAVLMGWQFTLAEFTGGPRMIAIMALLFKKSLTPNFLFADLIVLPILDIYCKYYGLKVTAFLLAIFYSSMTLAALAIEFLFGVLHLIPHNERHELWKNQSVGTTQQFSIYSFWRLQQFW
jgi:hypothetical protein